MKQPLCSLRSRPPGGALAVRSIALRCLGMIAIGLAACSTTPSSHSPVTTTATNVEIRAYFSGTGKSVLTFAGYSGSGYENEAAMLAAADRVLDDFDPKKTIVNIGATQEGIGAVYSLAKRRGFATTGIVSTQAKQYDTPLSPQVDRVFYVEDSTWGGYLQGSRELSPTSRAMVEASDIMVAIGGGDVARDEMLEGKRLGKDVRFIPADMNHGKALDAAARKGLPAPSDFRGAVHRVF